MQPPQRAARFGFMDRLRLRSSFHRLRKRSRSRLSSPINTFQTGPHPEPHLGRGCAHEKYGIAAARMKRMLGGNPLRGRCQTYRHYDGSSLQPADSVIVTEPMVFYGPTYWRRLFPAGILLFIAPTYGTWGKSALSRPVCAGWAWADGGHPLRGPHVSRVYSVVKKQSDRAEAKAGSLVHGPAPFTELVPSTP